MSESSGGLMTGRRKLGWTALLLAGTVLLAFGVFRALERDAFGAETEEAFQRFVGILAAFGPFLAWLGLGTTWEAQRKILLRRVATPTGLVLLCLALCISGLLLMAVSQHRDRYFVTCDPADATVWLGTRPIPCPSFVWAASDDPLIAFSPHYVRQATTVSEFRDGGTIAVQLTPNPPWRCRVLKKGLGNDSASWCAGRSLHATQVVIDIESGITASGSKLSVVPRAGGYIKLQTTRCSPRRPFCLDEDPDGAQCVDSSEPYDRAAELTISDHCIRTNRQLELEVVQCGATEPDGGQQFTLEVTEPKSDPAEIVCEE